MTITVTIDYKVRYKDSIRSVEIENVERLRKCKTPQNGYKTYKCPECGTIKYVPFTCKCRLCTSCGTKAANEWAEKIHHKLLKVPYAKKRNAKMQREYDFINMLFKNYDDGFVMNGKRRLEKREGWNMTAYIQEEGTGTGKLNFMKERLFS